MAELCQHSAADASFGDAYTPVIDGTIHCTYPLVGKGPISSLPFFLLEPLKHLLEMPSPLGIH